MALFSHKTQKSSGKRGFTLIELMVASTGALFITVGVYAFTRNVTEYFQRQMRLSDATMSAVAGFERLRTDIQRAGFLASPNLTRDPLRCPRPASGGATAAPQQIGGQLSGFPGLQQMGLAQIQQAATVDASNYMLNNNATGSVPGAIQPDSIILWGNYSSTERFSVKAVDGSNQIVLEDDSVAMRRLGIPTGSTAQDATILGSVFQTGRIVRVVDSGGRQQFAMIAGVDFTTDLVGDATIWLNPVVQMIWKSGADGATCGIRGQGTDLVANPVDIVRYRLFDLRTDSAFGALFSGMALPAYDTTRLDLVREQLDPTNLSVFAGTMELVTEYAVDLKFGLTVNTNPVTGANSYFGEDDANIPDYAGNPFGPDAGQLGTFGPHLIRGIHARLTVRTREADHNAPLLTGAALTNAKSEDLYRVAVAPGEYARLRSLRAHIATRNSRAEAWQ